MFPWYLIALLIIFVYKINKAINKKEDKDDNINNNLKNKENERDIKRKD